MHNMQFHMAVLNCKVVCVSHKDCSFFRIVEFLYCATFGQAVKWCCKRMRYICGKRTQFMLLNELSKTQRRLEIIKNGIRFVSVRDGRCMHLVKQCCVCSVITFFNDRNGNLYRWFVNVHFGSILFFFLLGQICHDFQFCSK